MTTPFVSGSFCSTCGNKASGKFCNSCGSALSATETPATPQHASTASTPHVSSGAPPAGHPGAYTPPPAGHPGAYTPPPAGHFHPGAYTPPPAGHYSPAHGVAPGAWASTVPYGSGISAGASVSIFVRVAAGLERGSACDAITTALMELNSIVEMDLTRSCRSFVPGSFDKGISTGKDAVQLCANIINKCCLNLPELREKIEVSNKKGITISADLEKLIELKGEAQGVYWITQYLFGLVVRWSDISKLLVDDPTAHTWLAEAAAFFNGFSNEFSGDLPAEIRTPMIELARNLNNKFGDRKGFKAQLSSGYGRRKGK